MEDNSASPQPQAISESALALHRRVARQSAVDAGFVRAGSPVVNVSITMPLWNEGSTPLTVLLEPLAERFTLPPGDLVMVHATSENWAGDAEFTLGRGDQGLTVYAPGSLIGFVDCYLARGGVRLAPDLQG